MDERAIEKFWQDNPCGDSQVGGLRDAHALDHEAFFREYDAFRYRKEAHILGCLDGIDFKGKRVLEIGLGEGADSEQIVRRGGIWSGLDLTPESIARVRARFALHHLEFESLSQGSVLEIPHEDHRFDIVFSHGVLHHVPDILAAQREIHRVLKSNGELIVMLYAKWSLNYLVAIGFVRRLALAGVLASGSRPGGTLGQHVDNAHREGMVKYLKMDSFIHRNTDGPLNPFARVYGMREVRRDFPDFEVVRSYKRFMHAPPLPVEALPLQSLLGWHLWVHLKPRTS